MAIIDEFLIELGFNDGGANQAIDKLAGLLNLITIRLTETNRLLAGMASAGGNVSNTVNNIDNSVNNLNQSLSQTNTEFNVLNTNVNNVDNSVNLTSRSITNFNTRITETSRNGVSLFRGMRNELLMFSGALGALGALGVLGGFVGNRFNQQAELGRTAQNINLSPVLIKQWEKAGQLYGVEPESVTGALREAQRSGELSKSFPQYTQEFQSAQNPLSFFGSGGNINAFYKGGTELLMEKSRLISAQYNSGNTMRAQEMANVMGVDDIFNLIKLGPEQMQAAIASQKDAALLSLKDAKESEKAAQSWIKLTGEVNAILDKLLNSFAPHFEILITKIDGLVDKVLPYLPKVEESISNAGGKQSGDIDAIANKYGKLPSYIRNAIVEQTELGKLIAGRQSAYGQKKQNMRMENMHTDIVKQLMFEGGLDYPHAQAVAATLWRESSFDTRAVGDSGESKGILQWSSKRRGDYSDWKHKNLEEQNIKEQVSFLLYEGKNKERNNWNAFLSETDTTKMQWQLIDKFVRPKDKRGALVDDLAIRRQMFNLDKKATTPSMRLPAKTDVTIGDINFYGVKDEKGVTEALKNYFGQNNFFTQFNTGQQ